MTVFSALTSDGVKCTWIFVPGHVSPLSGCPPGQVIAYSPEASRTTGHPVLFALLAMLFANDFLVLNGVP